MSNQKNIELQKAFGERVRQLRKAKGLSQYQLAIDANISLNQVGRIERGEINCTLSTIDLLALALKTTRLVLMDF